MGYWMLCGRDLVGCAVVGGTYSELLLLQKLNSGSTDFILLQCALEATTQICFTLLKTP